MHYVFFFKIVFKSVIVYQVEDICILRFFMFQERSFCPFKKHHTFQNCLFVS